MGYDARPLFAEYEANTVYYKDVTMFERRRFEGIIISHLGNIDGREPEQENTLAYIKKALAAGWHVCVDVLYRNGAFVLPSPRGFQPIPPALLSNQRVWARTFDAETIDGLCTVKAHCVIATNAPITLTSEQFIWTLPPTTLVDRSIAVFPEIADPTWLGEYAPAGVCTNHPAQYI
jgi:hypothetical protein